MDRNQYRLIIVYNTIAQNAITVKYFTFLLTRTLGHALSLHLLAKNRSIMGYKTRLKIGEFSRLMQVTVKTLRHYEQKELLIPNEVDEWTGYRYYSIGK